MWLLCIPDSVHLISATSFPTTLLQRNLNIQYEWISTDILRIRFLADSGLFVRKYKYLEIGFPRNILKTNASKLRKKEKKEIYFAQILSRAKSMRANAERLGGTNRIAIGVGRTQSDILTHATIQHEYALKTDKA